MSACFTAASLDGVHLTEECKDQPWFANETSARVKGEIDVPGIASSNELQYSLKFMFSTLLLHNEDADLLYKTSRGPSVVLHKRTGDVHATRPLPTVTEGDINLGAMLDAKSTGSWAAEMYGYNNSAPPTPISNPLRVLHSFFSHFFFLGGGVGVFYGQLEADILTCIQFMLLCALLMTP